MEAEEIRQFAKLEARVDFLMEQQKEHDARLGITERICMENSSHISYLIKQAEESEKREAANRSKLTIILTIIMITINVFFQVLNASGKK